MTSPPYDGPDTVGWSNGDSGPNGYMNTYLGQFDGAGNPNTRFSPNIGTYSNATTFTYGTGGNTSVKGVAPMKGTNYADWNWEEILYQVLGVSLPDRSEVTSGRWTGVEINTSGDGNHFYIYGVTWSVGSDTNYSGNDALVYLQPALQAKGAPWDAYLNDFPNAVWSPDTGFYPKNVDLDATTFIPPTLALSGVEGMFHNASTTLESLSSALSSDATQFKGKAGGAFAQLVNDLYKQSSTAYAMMTGSNPPYSSYSGLVGEAGSVAAKFMLALWNAYANWSNLIEHSPLGAILATLVAGGVVTTVTDSNGVTQYEANPGLDPNFSSFGMLTTDAAWQKIDTAAQALWKAGLKSALDYPAGQALAALVKAYEAAANYVRPLKLKAPPPIAQPNSMAIPNVGGGSGSVPNLISQLGKNMDGGLNSLFHFLPNLGKGIGGDFNSLFHIFPNLDKGIGGGFNSLFHSLAAIPNMNKGLYGGLNGLYGGLNGLNGDLAGLGRGIAGGFNGLAGGFGGQKLGGPNTLSPAFMSVMPNGTQAGVLSPAPLLSPTSANALGQQFLTSGVPGAGGNPAGQLGSGLTQPVTSALQDALTGTVQTQAALEQALASGQVPPTGPLHDALTAALADNGATQAALQQALASGNPSTAALQTALAGNQQTQTALNQALASGQVPSTGPLASNLQTALAGTGQTQTALQQALAGGLPASSTLHSALADNSQTRAALDQALASGQVPATGPLHTALQTALADTGKTQSELTQALASGSPSQIQAALADNSQTRAAIQRALASGQVPATGPLHNALTSALADTGKTSAALNQALLASTPGGASLHQAMTSDTALQGALHRALASGQVPKVGSLHDAVQSALTDSGKVQNALHQALAGGSGTSTAAIQRALTDNRALQAELHRALGQAPKTGPLHTDLQNALTDSQKMGSELHQALAARGIAAEPGASVLAGGPTALTGGLAGLGSTPLISSTATPAGLAQLGGAGGLGAGGLSGGVGGSGLAGTSGLASGVASGLPASSGRFVPPVAGAAPAAAAGAAGGGTAASGFPMYTPMAGGMGGMGGMGAGGQPQDRERTTWLAEDEDVWGTEPDVAPHVLGRDVVDDDDEVGDYIDTDRDTAAARRARARLYGG